MLLLVIDAELDQLQRPRRHSAVAEETRQGFIDVVAIGANLTGAWPRQQPASGARLPRPDTLVVGVEAILETLVEDLIAGKERLEQERLEEPRRMREMPFG